MAEAAETEPQAAGASDAPPSDEVELKFVIMPEGFMHTRKYAKSLTLAEVKAKVETELRIPPTSMKLTFQGSGASPPPHTTACAPTHPARDPVSCQQR